MLALLFLLLVAVTAEKFSVFNYARILPMGVSHTSTVQNTSIPSVKINLQEAQFKAYYPAVFQMLRRHAGITEDDFIQAMTLENLLCFSSDSKSGQTFWVSADNRVILKTIKHYECKNLHRILLDYANHMVMEKSCIASILGLYRVRLRNGVCKYFLATRNVYPSDDTQVLNKYDLKGSTVGRIAKATSSVKKDLDLIASGAWIKLGPSRDLVMRALTRDATFLSRHGFMDYSLLVAEERQGGRAMRRFGPNPDILSVFSLDPTERYFTLNTSFKYAHLFVVTSSHLRLQRFLGDLLLLVIPLPSFRHSFACMELYYFPY